jgi:rod shape-determining protein MreC
MSLRDGPLNDIRPPRGWLAAAVLLAATLAALAIYLADRRGGSLGEARRAANGAAGVVGGALSAPVRWIGGAVGVMSDYILAGQQNHQLKRQLVEAQAWRDKAEALAEENARLSALLGVRTDPPIPMVFAHTILDARGPFANTRIADAGGRRGVIEGNPVMSDHGLVGRVTGVAPTVSRIMLLTDVESRTPVLIGRTNGRAILTGDGGQSPKLDYLRTHDPIRPGDRILTSGDGGVLPRGLPVGVAVRDLEGGWRVALDSDAAPIDFVRIMLFRDFAQLASPAALDPATLRRRRPSPPHPRPRPSPRPRRSLRPDSRRSPHRR